MHTIHIFGKEGCAKCSVLKNRVIQLLQSEKYSGFKMQYSDVKTVEGLVEFCSSEVLNLNRIPSFIVRTESAVPRSVAPTNSSQIKTVIGLQTDYDNGGILTPAMISAELDAALNF